MESDCCYNNTHVFAKVLILNNAELKGKSVQIQSETHKLDKLMYTSCEHSTSSPSPSPILLGYMTLRHNGQSVQYCQYCVTAPPPA